MPRPSPRLPPVTRTLAILAHQLSAGVISSAATNLTLLRGFVRRQFCAAKCKNILFQRVAVGAGLANRLVQHNVGHDDCAGDRIAPTRPTSDIFTAACLLMICSTSSGWHFQAADIDDAAAPADKIIAAVATRPRHLRYR